MPLFVGAGSGRRHPAFPLITAFERKHLKACEKFQNGGSPKAIQLLSCAPPREDAGVAERDGFEIRCVSDST